MYRTHFLLSLDGTSPSQDDIYPSAWKNNPILSAEFLLDSPSDCCERFFKDQQCAMISSCEEDAIDPCTEWHVSTQADGAKTCTNDDVYPSGKHEHDTTLSTLCWFSRSSFSDPFLLPSVQQLGKALVSAINISSPLRKHVVRISLPALVAASKQ